MSDDVTVEAAPKAAARALAQKTGEKTFRKQLRDPVRNDRRYSVTGATLGEVMAKAEVVRSIRRDVKEGFISPREASMRTTRAVHGAVLVTDLWRAYVPTRNPRWRGKLKSVWAHQLAPWFGDLRAWEVDEEKLGLWFQARRAAGIKPKTLDNAFSCLRGAFKLGVSTGKLTVLPWGAWRIKLTRRNPEDPDQREACRSLEEFEALILAAREHDAKMIQRGRFADLVFRVVVVGLTGLRAGEACGLGWDRVEIDTAEPLIRIVCQVTDSWQKEHPEWARPEDLPKHEKRRRQYLHPSAVLALRAQRQNLQRHGFYRHDGPVFPRHAAGGQWRTHAEIIDPDTFRGLVADAGLPNVEHWTPHSLRHSFATLEAVASGGDLRRVQERTGHSTLEILEGYIKRAGRGAARTFVAPLTAGLLPPRETGPGPGPALLPRVIDTLGEAAEEGAEALPMPVASKSLCDLVQASQASAESYQEGVEVAKRLRRRAKDRAFARQTLSFDGAAKAWIDAGRPGVRPVEITEIAEKHYNRAYSAALRDECSPSEAARRAKCARIATVGAFGKALKRVERAAAALALEGLSPRGAGPLGGLDDEMSRRAKAQEDLSPAALDE